MLSKTQFGAMAGVFAAASISATPAAAANVPAAPAAAPASSVYANFGQSAYDGELEIAERHRYRRWGRGWGHRGWRRNRVDAGDVLAGVLIIGGIAAIASSSNKREREREREYRRQREYERDYDRRYDRRNDRRNTGASGLDSAVDQCVSQIERDVRIESVDSVNRNADGWMVAGALFNGSGFTCQIDNKGEISNIDYGGFQGASYDAGGSTTRARGDDLQWSDASYSAARARVGGAPQAELDTDGPQPAYPGGPIPGETYPEEIDGDLGG